MAILFLASAVGCVERGQPTRVHEKAATEQNATKKRGAPNASGDSLTDSSALNIDNAILDKLARELLVKKSVENAEVRGDELTPRKLWRLNEELSLVLKSTTATDAQKQWLLVYEFYLTEGCGDDLQRCLNFDFFKLSKNSASVAVLLANRETTDLKRRYRLLRLAYSLKGKMYDANLAKQMLVTAPAYLELLESEEHTLAVNFAHVLTTVSQQVAAQGSAEEMKLLVEKLDLMNLESRQRLLQLGFGSNIMTQILAKAGGIANSSTNQENGQSKITEYFVKPLGLKTVHDKLVAEQASMFTQLNVEQIKNWDESLLVLDQAYMGELSIDQANIMLRALKTSRADIAAKTRQVYLIRFLQALADSTFQAQKIFFEQKVSSDDFLMHAVRSGTAVQPIWGTFTSRTKNLGTLSLGVLRLGSQDDQIYDRTFQLFEGTQKNIKFMSVYPQMMALTYHMSKRDAKRKIDWGWRKFELDSTVIIEKLFTGEFPAWFDYSTDKKPLTFIEMLYAFDFALRTGVFERFKVNPDEFVAEISERLVRRTSSNVRKFSLLRYQREQSLSYWQFERLCTQFEKQKIRLPVSLTTIANSPVLGDLAGPIFSGVSRRDTEKRRGSEYRQSYGLMVFDSEFTKVAEEARLDLGNMQTWIEGLISSYRASLNRQGVLNIEARLKGSVDQLNLLKEFRADFFRNSLTTYKNLDSCYMKAHRLDEDVKLDLLRREEAFLKQIHKDLSRVKNGEVTPEVLNAQYAFKNLPSQFAGKNRFTQDGYVYSDIDFWIRSILYMVKDQQIGGQNWPAIAPRMQPDFGKKLDADNEFVRKSIGAYLTYNESEEEFVKQGMGVLFNKTITSESKSSYVNWYNVASGRIIMWSDRLHSAAILYRVSDPELVSRICRAPMICGSQKDLVSAEEFIAKHEEMLSAIKLGDEERRYMQMAGIYYKFDMQYFNRRVIDYSVIKNHSIQQLWGLYDLPAFLATRNVLGLTHSMAESSREADGADPGMAKSASAEAQRHFGSDQLGRSYWEVRQIDARKSFLVPVSEEIDQSLDLAVGNIVRREIEKVKHFSQVLISRTQQMAALSAQDRPRADLTMVEVIRGPMVRMDLLNNYERDLEKWQQRTGHCYEKADCESFKPQ